MPVEFLTDEPIAAFSPLGWPSTWAQMGQFFLLDDVDGSS
jgi:hypothetical protein